MTCPICGHRPHPGFACNIPEGPDSLCECPFEDRRVEQPTLGFDKDDDPCMELRREVARLRAENERLLSDPGRDTVGKFTVGRSGSSESKAAAYAVAPKTGTKRERVLELITLRPDGLTDEELQRITGWDIRCINARRKELEQGGWVEKATWTRTARSGTEVCVWVLSSTGADRQGIRRGKL